MSEIRISVLCPTRGRTKLMKRVLENCFGTCKHPSQVELIFGLDDDDFDSIEKAKELQKEYSEYNVEYTVWPRKKYVFSDLMNQCAKPSKGDIFNLMSDDAVHATANWDQIAIDIFDSHRDKIILVQTRGGANAYTGLPFMHRNWKDAAGYILAPIFNGDWGDYWIADVISQLPGERFMLCEEIEITHLHAEFGKMEKDQTFYEHLEEREAQEALPRSEHPYHGGEGKRLKQLEIDRLREFIKNFKEEK
tara:strand:- start:30833 stop:31579 length:747 start_codon:yes stop_codon:yes gene_type:complete